MCRVLEVSRSGYYAWVKRPMSQRAKESASLVEQIKTAYTESRKAYGSPRIHRALRRKGITCGHNRIARLMRENEVVSKHHRRKRSTATRHGRCDSKDLVQRRFDVEEPDHTWAADITHLWTGSGWLYLSVVMDLYSRRIIGWAMRSRMTEELPIDALEMAVLNRAPEGSLIHHSDRGSQYSSHAFQARLERHGFQGSMNYQGDCYDNAVVESFFKSLKTELCRGVRFKTREEAKGMLFEYIEVFYNRERLHSTLDYQSPVEYERINSSELCVH